MPKFVTIKIPVERRTYVKGTFKGKFTGPCDLEKSDLIRENFFDLEYLESEIISDHNSVRRWQDGGEFVEFVDVDTFPLLEHRQLPVAFTNSKEIETHYLLELNEPKLRNISLIKQLYEGDIVFVTISGEISGFLKHSEIEERQVEVEDEKPIAHSGKLTGTIASESPTKSYEGQSVSDEKRSQQPGSGLRTETHQTTAVGVPQDRIERDSSNPFKRRFNKAVTIFRSPRWLTSQTSRQLYRHPIFRPARIAKNWIGRGLWRHRNGLTFDFALNGCAMFLGVTLFSLYAIAIVSLLVSAIAPVIRPLLPKLGEALLFSLVGFLLFIFHRILPKRWKWLIFVIVLLYFLLMLAA